MAMRTTKRRKRSREAKKTRLDTIGDTFRKQPPLILGFAWHDTRTMHLRVVGGLSARMRTMTKTRGEGGDWTKRELPCCASFCQALGRWARGGQRVRLRTVLARTLRRISGIVGRGDGYSAFMV